MKYFSFLLPSLHYFHVLQKKTAHQKNRQYILLCSIAFNVEKERLSSTIKLPAQLAAFEEVSIFPK